MKLATYSCTFLLLFASCNFVQPIFAGGGSHGGGHSGGGYFGGGHDNCDKYPCKDCAAADECLIVFDFNKDGSPEVNDPHIENTTEWNNGYVYSDALKIFSVNESKTSFAFEVAEGYVLDIDEISFTTDSVWFFRFLDDADFTLSLAGDSSGAFAESEDGSFSKKTYTYSPALTGLKGLQTFSFDLEADGAFKWFLDDFKVCGTVSAVPEPSTLAALALFSIGGVFLRRKKLLK